MIEELTVPSVQRSVTVEAPVERAFAVFTDAFGTWWPAGHHIGAADPEAFVIEPFLGGRWFERGVDGTECDWGRVLTWEPPHRLVLSWHLNADWEYVPDAARASEIEVTFTAETPAFTRVDLEHRHLERHGRGDEIRLGVSRSGGWGGLLVRYAETLEARSEQVDQ